MSSILDSLKEYLRFIRDDERPRHPHCVRIISAGETRIEHAHDCPGRDDITLCVFIIRETDHKKNPDCTYGKYQSHSLSLCSCR